MSKAWATILLLAFIASVTAVPPVRAQTDRTRWTSIVKGSLGGVYESFIVALNAMSYRIDKFDRGTRAVDLVATLHNRAPSRNRPPTFRVHIEQSGASNVFNVRIEGASRFMEASRTPAGPLRIELDRAYARHRCAVVD
jgi:hypothetical protein